jgi:guanosine-3',5'-bis(diphosphate) 3'-pyrophosphohydrolase
MLEKAIIIAAEAHKMQVDKSGKPYILHPLRVMLNVETKDEMICAVLHDVIEDSKVKPKDLLEKGFTVEIIEAILSVTKNPEDKDYFDFIERAKKNPIGRKVKIADLNDNLDISRIDNPKEKDYERMEKYRKALLQLETD